MRARLLSKPTGTGRGRIGATRTATAWIAIFGLYLHLLAAALCVGTPVAAAGAADHPICHAHAVDRGPATGHPDHPSDAPCPFCFAHAQVAAMPAPAPAPTARTAPRIVVVARLIYADPIRPRCPSSASPRGPPAAV